MEHKSFDTILQVLQLQKHLMNGKGIYHYFIKNISQNRSIKVRRGKYGE